MPGFALRGVLPPRELHERPGLTFSGGRLWLGYDWLARTHVRSFLVGCVAAGVVGGQRKEGGLSVRCSPKTGGAFVLPATVNHGLILLGVGGWGSEAKKPDPTPRNPSKSLWEAGIPLQGTTDSAPQTKPC